MSTTTNSGLFGPGRQRVGYEEQEWAVWILGMDDIHEQASLEEALEFAAEHNAMFADIRMRHEVGRHTLHAVVLHHGYAWSPAVEHQLGIDCGRPNCLFPCGANRAFRAAEQQPIRCTRCQGEDGPFTDDRLCEACARPMPLDGVA